MKLCGVIYFDQQVLQYVIFSSTGTRWLSQGVVVQIGELVTKIYFGGRDILAVGLVFVIVNHVKVVNAAINDALIHTGY